MVKIASTQCIPQILLKLSMSTSDWKLHISPLSFYLWLDGINLRFKSCLDNKSKETEAVGVRNFAKFTAKHLWLSLFFNKVAGLRPVTLLKKRLWHKCFLVNFVKFLRAPFLKEHLYWLLLRKGSITKEFEDLNVGEQKLLAKTSL